MILLPLLALQAPGEVLFVRHAETVANATGRYNGQTLNRLSPKGENQARRLADRLPARFNEIYVSPAERALRTLAPYLRKTGQRATVWPELLECCHQRGSARRAAAGPLRYGPKVAIPADLRGLYRVDPKNARLIDASTYNAGLRQVQMLAHNVRLLPPERSVLLVGHSIAGGKLFESLTRRQNRVKVENAEPIRLERSDSGWTVRKAL